jgi:hypothetical protein
MWTPGDTALALEWQSEKNLLCESCGHHLDETIGADMRRYEAAEMTCRACQVIEWRREALSQQEAPMAGLRIYAVKGASDG